MNAPIPTLWTTVQRLLRLATRDARHPFRTPVVATIDPEGKPNARTVVLRHYADGNFRFYTDRRSAKYGEILRSPWTQWTFWSPDDSLQVRVLGISTELDAAATLAIFGGLDKKDRKAYATLDPPGHVLAAPGTGLPENWETMKGAETDFSLPNFCVLETELRTAEVLHLDREGHRRLSVETDEDGEMSFTWVVP